MDKDIMNLMSLTKADQPVYKQMTDYLQERGAVPAVKAEYLGDSVAGVFRTNVFRNGPLPAAGEIALNVRDKSTLIHETVHATQRQLDAQYTENKDRFGFFGQPTQFQSGYEKLIWNKFDARTLTQDKISQMISTLAPEFATSQSSYRASPREAQAFAVEETSVPGGRYSRPAPPHTDPTLATEFLILLDLAQRDQKKKTTPQGR